MEAWLHTSYASLPTTSSSSTPSSSASLYPPLFFDVADDLWFYRSVLPLPSLSLPCFPALSSPAAPAPSPSPDPSTLIADCMNTPFSPSPRPPLSSSSSSSPTPPPDSQLWDLAYPAPQENYAESFSAYHESAYRAYNENAYAGYSSSTDSDEDEDTYPVYPHANAAEDEEAYHYYTASSDWDDEDAYHGYHGPSSWEDKQGMLPANLHAGLEPEDALSGIYDGGVLLKDQHHKRRREVSYSRFQRDAVSLVSAPPQIEVPSRNEQGDMKENLKLWAHAVASTLPWKAAAQARSLL